MTIEALVKLLTEYGPVGTTLALIILAVLVGITLKKLESNAKADSERAQTFQDCLKKYQEETDKKFAEQAERMAVIERDYVTRESHYKDIGGWRSEIAQLRSDNNLSIQSVREAISGLTSNIISAVIEGAKKNGC